MRVDEVAMRKEAVGRKDVGRGLKRPRVRRGCARAQDRTYARDRNHWWHVTIRWQEPPCCAFLPASPTVRLGRRARAVVA